MTDFSRSINRIFTKKTFNELLTNGSSKIYNFVVDRYVDDPENKTNGELISSIYGYLNKQKRNEYYYTNTLINKLLIGVHNVNTTTALSQVRIASHIADIVMINGEGRVYEIKSDIDNLVRLNEQVSDYFKAFNKVSVLIPEHEIHHAEKTLNQLGDMGKAVGIYALSERDTFIGRKIGREPIEYKENLDYYSIFTLMRKNEYMNVIRTFYGEIPNVAPAFIFKKCFELFTAIDILEAQKLVFSEIKKRNKISTAEFDQIPEELKTIVYFSELRNQIPNILLFLQKPYIRRR